MNISKVYVEIPHRRPPLVYLATDKELIELAEEQEAEYMAENDTYHNATVEDAEDALAHDLPSFLVFDDLVSAQLYYKEHKKHHQALAVLGLLSLMLDTE